MDKWKSTTMTMNTSHVLEGCTPRCTTIARLREMRSSCRQTWLSSPGPALLKRHVVELLQANPRSLPPTPRVFWWRCHSWGYWRLQTELRLFRRLLSTRLILHSPDIFDSEGEWYETTITIIIPSCYVSFIDCINLYQSHVSFYELTLATRIHANTASTSLWETGSLTSNGQSWQWQDEGHPT